MPATRAAVAIKARMLSAQSEQASGASATEPRLKAIKKSGSISPPGDPREIQRQAITGDQSAEDRINVRLLINGSDDDGIRAYDEQLPVSILRAILDPGVGDFYVPIEGSARTKPPRTKAHFLHTSAIREILILDAYPLFEDA